MFSSHTDFNSSSCPQAASHHSSAMLTTEGAPYTADSEELKMDVEDADMTKWTEDEFEEKCTYVVKDHTWEGPVENTRAEASLPRNLAFKHPAHTKEVRQRQHTLVLSEIRSQHKQTERVSHYQTARTLNGCDFLFKRHLHKATPTDHTTGINLLYLHCQPLFC